MVAVPTSKLRFAWASCSEIATLPLDECQAVLRGEHVEIGLRNAYDEILGRLAENGFGLRRLESGLLVDLDVLPIEQGLRERNRETVGVAQPLGIRRRAAERNVDIVVLGERGGIDGGQDLRQPLRKVFQAGVARRACRSIRRVVRERVA